MYLGEGHSTDLAVRLSVEHYRLPSPWSGADPRGALFRCGIETNLAFLRAELNTGKDQRPASLWRILALLETIESIDARVASSLADSAVQLRVCPNHLGRLFKGITGIPFRSFLRKYRVVRTAELLSETIWTLEEIAGVLGHSQSSHLVREFGDEIGVTPGQFRQLS